MTKRPEIIDLALNGQLIEALQQRIRPKFELAACSDMDTELFFTEDSFSTYRAKAVCKTCPIAAACGEWAKANAEFGVFGGMTALERNRQAKSVQKFQGGNQMELKSALNFLLDATAPEVALRYGVDSRTVMRWRNILRVALDVA